MWKAGPFNVTPALPPPPPSLGWQTLAIGAGGFITSIEATGLKNDTADGLMVCRTDTFGAYYWNGSKWVQCFTIASMPAGDVGMSNTTGEPVGPVQGCYEITIAPSNHSIFYAVYNGFVYKSVNGGQTWTKTALSQKANTDPNSGNKAYSPRLAVDPSDANIVYFGAPSGLFRSADGGANWTTIASVPAATNENGIIVNIDQTSASGGSRVVFASSTGNGVYRSSDGGLTFTKISGSGTGTTAVDTHRHAIIDVNGVYWQTINDGSSQPLYKYASGSWTHITNLGGQGARANSIVVDPNNVNNVWLGCDSGNLISTVNGGTTWSDPDFSDTRVAGVGDVTWLANTNETYMSNGNQVYNRANNRVYFAEGIGVWYTAAPGISTQWTSQARGIEQLVGNVVIVPPGGRPVTGSWDRPSFYSITSNVYPAVQNPNQNVAINSGWAVSWSPQTNSTLYGLFTWFGINASSKSIDGGQTWTEMSAQPSTVQNLVSFTASLSGTTLTVTAVAYGFLSNGMTIDGAGVPASTVIQSGPGTGGPGTYTVNNSATISSEAMTVPAVSVAGTIIATSDTHAIIVQSGSAAATVYYTGNSGGSWTEAVFPGTISGNPVPQTNTGFTTGWGFAYFLNRHVGDVDTTVSDTAYVFNPGDGSALPNFSGVYKTVNGGATWVQVFSGVITTFGDGLSNVTMRCVPTKTGHLFYTGGGSTGGGSPGAASPLKRSSDGGVSWQTVPNVTQVYGIGFGAPAPGGSYPSIYIAGFVTLDGGSTYHWGIWRSTNGNLATPTWTLLGPTDSNGNAYPNNSFDTITWVEGDMSNYGYVYVAFRGSGWAYGYFS